MGEHRGQFRIGAVVLAWGVQAIVAQSLLVREALVLMYGSEFAWGIVLFAWLLGVAAGGALGGRLSKRIWHAEIGLAVVLLGLSVAVPVELWAFRGARAWLGIEAGELLPLGKTAIAAMLLIPPIGGLVGMAFPLACSVRVAGDCAAVKGAGPLARVYAVEAAGSLVGGAAFSFWAVEKLGPMETALLCGAMTVAACAGLLHGNAEHRARVITASGWTAVAAAMLLAAVSAGGGLDRMLVERRWRNLAPGYELVADAESKYQNLALGKRAGQFTLYCNGQVSAGFPDPYTFGPLAHFWMCQHPGPRRVLVLGGGAEGLLAEILRHPAETVDYADPDSRTIELIAPYLTQTDRRALQDPRVTVHAVDGRYFIKTQRERFDLVIARLPEPASAQRARFYTDEFYGELRRAMTPQSVLCMTAAAAPANLSQASAEYLASIRGTLRRHFAHVTIGWGDPAQVLAATQDGLVSTDPRELARRYEQRKIRSGLFDPLWFEGATDWLEAGKVRLRAAELDAIPEAPISTDLRPVVYIQRLALWERMTGGASGGVVERLRSIGRFEVATVLVALVMIVLIAWRLRRGARSGWSEGMVVVSVGTTGFATMALSVVWLFAFQNLYGYVYQRIGWIIALFMGGLVIGCWWVGVRSKQQAAGGSLSAWLWRRLIGTDVGLAALAVAVPVVLPALAGMQETRVSFALVEAAVSVLVAATGILGGAAFASAGGLQLAALGRPGAAAGSVVGADHAGACLGALLTGILLVPVLGTTAAALVLAGMKACSALLLGIGWRLSGRYHDVGGEGCEAGRGKSRLE